MPTFDITISVDGRERSPRPLNLRARQLIVRLEPRYGHLGQRPSLLLLLFLRVRHCLTLLLLVRLHIPCALHAEHPHLPHEAMDKEQAVGLVGPPLEAPHPIDATYLHGCVLTHAHAIAKEADRALSFSASR